MPRLRLPHLLLVAAGGLTIAGCTTSTDTGADDYKGTQKDVADAVQDLYDAAGKGKPDTSKICDELITANLKAEYVAYAKSSKRGIDCTDALDDSLRDVQGGLDIDITEVKVTGATATVKVKTKATGDDPIETLALRNEGGWRLSALPAPSGTAKE